MVPTDQTTVSCLLNELFPLHKQVPQLFNEWFPLMKQHSVTSVPWAVPTVQTTQYHIPQNWTLNYTNVRTSNLTVHTGTAVPVYTVRAHREQRYSSTNSLPWHNTKLNGQLQTPAPLPLTKEPTGPRAGLDVLVNLLPLLGFEPPKYHSACSLSLVTIPAMLSSLPSKSTVLSNAWSPDRVKLHW